MLLKKIMEVLSHIHFNQNHVWFTDDPKWVFSKKNPPQPFPDFIDKIREDVEKSYWSFLQFLV